MSAIASVLVAVGAAACGGGGGGAVLDGIPTSTAAITPSTAPASSVAAASGLDTSAAAGAVSSDTALQTPTPSNSDAVGTARALSATASLALEGVPEAPGPTTPLAMPAGGRVFHVNSQAGDDRNDGSAATAPTAAANTTGPWKSLARVMQSDLGPGDTLVLACGSTWNETLRVPADGTATRPVLVTAPAAGCGSAARPTIDGSITLPAASWRLQTGAIWEARVDQPVLALTSSAAIWRVAHHPNRGYRAEVPASPYLALAADSPNTTTLMTADDLKLPTGVRLQDGARVRVRTNAWWMDDARVTGFEGGRISLASATRYPTRAGVGFYLVGQRWMLDSASEWFHDAATGSLAAWMPGASAPTAPLYATVLPVGVDLANRAYVALGGIGVRRVGMGVRATSSTAVQLRSLLVEDTVGVGIEASASQALLIESSDLIRTGADAVQGESHLQASASDLTLRNSVVRDSAVRMDGELAATLPVATYAAVAAGVRAVISGNLIINSGYIGVRVGSDSQVQGNFVYGACSQLDDCAGIYTWSSRNVSIRSNTVIRSRGTTYGKPPAETGSAAQGIYLDESTTGALVEDNTVIDTDHGIQVHVSQDSTLRGNRLYANRRSQIWLQATRNRDRAAGDVFGIVVEDNQIAPVLPGSIGLWLQTAFSSTQGFGSFDRNRYYDRVVPAVAVVSTATGSRPYTVAQWRAARDVGSVLPLDTNSTAVSLTPYASVAPSGANLVPNGSLLAGMAGWSHWNETAPSGQLLLQACDSGPCLRYQAGGSSGLVSSPNFSVVAGQWYRISIDLAADQDAQPVQVVLRRGGGGTNGYEALSTADTVTFMAGRSMARYAVVVQATKTVNARDPATGDNGARLDVQGLLSGASVKLANVEVVPVQPLPAAFTTAAVVNAGAISGQVACPLALQQAGMCAAAVALSGQSALAWPVSLAPRSAMLLFVQPTSLLDTDMDGIPDSLDTCPATPAGQVVNAAGCSLGQR